MFINQKTDEDYERLILQAKEANFNMLRVWGGGIYERDVFYDLCDEHGILVWQDFMFACSMYPGNKEFLSSVKDEVTYQVKRLRNHPCIAHWNGNNEVNVAWHNWGWQKEYDLDEKTQQKIKTDYDRLFSYSIPQIIGAYDKRTYTHTSPLSNWGPKGDFNAGSMHYWGVWHNREPFENYYTNVGRFMSEYGFQSFPDLELLHRYIPKDSLFLTSESMKHRQKSYIGNGLIAEHISQYFPEPQTFKEFTELSQLTQAIAYEKAIEAHRQNRPHCMGTLYWQLNDCWPGPSWSTIDYTGNEKAAHLKVKEMYEQMLPIIQAEGRDIKLWLSNDGKSAVQCQINLQMINAKTGKVLSQKSIQTKINSTSTKEISTLKKFLKSKKKNTYLRAEVVQNNQVVSSRNIILDWKNFSRCNGLEKSKQVFLNQ